MERCKGARRSGGKGRRGDSVLRAAVISPLAKVCRVLPPALFFYIQCKTSTCDGCSDRATVSTAPPPLD